MPVSRVEDTSITNSVVWGRLRVASYVATLGGDLTIGDNFPPILILDPGGVARNLTLPTAADAKFVVFEIRNTADAAENLVVKDGVATVATIGQGQTGRVYSDGSSWYSLGVV